MGAFGVSWPVYLEEPGANWRVIPDAVASPAHHAQVPARLVGGYSDPAAGWLVCVQIPV